MATSKEKYLSYFSLIKRDGASELVKFIESTDFFTAPGSTRYHGNYEGGLVDHTINVCERLRQLAPEYPAETVVIVSLLHDLCKANFYKVDYKNQKNNATGQWERVPYYAIDDQQPIGNHGDKSVFLIMKYMQLTDEEIAAIRFHMGACQEGDIRGWGNACEKYPLTVLLHIADLQATYFDDRKV